MSIRACDACGGTRSSTLLANQTHLYCLGNCEHSWTYNLIKCELCGLVYIDPEPSWDILQTFYPPSYGSYNLGRLLPRAEAESIKYRLATWRYPTPTFTKPKTKIKQFLAIVSELISGKMISYPLAIPLSLPKDAQIFELGYGSGNWLLSMAALGYNNLYGYDIDANTDAQRRLKDSGIHVTDGAFLANEYPENFFDCIRLEHVFEHLLNPVGVIQKCHRMLKPGGILVMSFPSSQSLSFWLSVKYSAVRDSPRHLYLHTLKSARLLLAPIGFQAIKARAYPVPSVFGATLNNWLVTKSGRVSPQLFSLLGPFYVFVSYALKSGEFITLMAIK